MREILCYYVKGETLVVDKTLNLCALRLLSLAADTLGFATGGKTAPPTPKSDPAVPVLIKRDVRVFSDVAVSIIRVASHALQQHFSNFLSANRT